MIEEYTFGSIQIQGQVYRDDVLICDRGMQVVCPWWRKRGHTVQVGDLANILDYGPRVLVLGQGKPGMMKASRELKQYLQERGIDLVEEPSQEAVSTFNRLVDQGERVCGGFHLTC